MKFNFREFLFTGLYSGYSPVAPGTAGTLVAFLIYVIAGCLMPHYAWILNFVIVVAMFYPAIKLGDDAEKFFKTKDPSQVVLDEMMGYWIALLFFPFSIRVSIAGFILFRMFDIWKPYPIRLCEKIKGGAGIMLDDYVSGLFAWIVLAAILLIQIKSGYQIFYDNEFLRSTYLGAIIK